MFRVFEFTESILIEVPRDAVWEVVRDIERWWLASNPEHQSLELLGGRGELAVGTQLRIREKIAGIPGEAVGMITRLEPGQKVTWDAPHARYRWFGMSLSLSEGVTWRLESHGESTTVSARVWAEFPAGLRGSLTGMVFRVIGGVQKDREHTRTELRYLKHRIES